MYYSRNCLKYLQNHHQTHLLLNLGLAFIPVNGAILASPDTLSLYVNVALSCLSRIGSVVFIMQFSSDQHSFHLKKFLQEKYDGKLSQMRSVLFAGTVHNSRASCREVSYFKSHLILDSRETASPLSLRGVRLWWSRERFNPTGSSPTCSESSGSRCLNRVRWGPPVWELIWAQLHVRLPPKYFITIKLISIF